MGKKIFVGSSSESLPLARELSELVNNRSDNNHMLFLELWHSGFFTLSRQTLEVLLNDLPERDGAIFVIIPEDEKLDPKSHRRPRDNVFLEIGLALARFEMSRVVIVRSKSVTIGADLYGFTCLEIEDKPDAAEKQRVADDIYSHFTDNPKTASARLGRDSFRQLELERHLTQRVLTALKCSGLGYDRIRLYRLNKATESFEGIVELGGVADNFHRARIPIRTDVLSQVLLDQRSCLHLRKSSKGDKVEIFVGKEGTTDPQHLEQYKGFVPHDLPSLERGDLREWLDVPIMALRGPNIGSVLGKMTIDNARRPRSKTGEWTLNPCDSSLYRRAAEAAEIIVRFDDKKYPMDISDRNDINVDAVYKQAFRLAVMDDHLRTVLAEMRGRFGFDRLRLYLTIDKHLQLFKDYSMAVVPHTPLHTHTLGFWGHVELGGVRTLFSDLVVTEALDPCARIILSKPMDKDQLFHEMLQLGEPVIFTKGKGDPNCRPAKCQVSGFYNPEELDRGSGESEIVQHLDLPILSNGDIIGKVTIDNKWRQPEGIAVTKSEVEPLKHFALKISALISAAEHIPNEQLCIAIERILQMRLK